MWAEDWAYVWGGASVDKIDCSGVLVYVYKQHGLKIYHGSNRIARVHVERLIPIDEALRDGLIVPGMVAFRSRAPGEAKYSLGGQYKPGGKYHNGDLRGYYHIGVVDEDIDYVLNAAGTASDFERHPIREGWSHVARLIDVDYDTPYEEDAPMIDTHETIRKGAKGPSVAAMQGMLIRQGYDIEADGKFGAKTETALRAFQRANDLEADGVCGPVTWTALQTGLPDVELQPEPETMPKTWDTMTLEARTEWLLKAVRLLADGVISVGGTLVLNDGHVADMILAVTGGDTNGS